MSAVLHAVWWKELLSPLPCLLQIHVHAVWDP